MSIYVFQEGKCSFKRKDETRIGTKKIIVEGQMKTIYVKQNTIDKNKEFDH